MENTKMDVFKFCLLNNGILKTIVIFNINENSKYDEIFSELDQIKINNSNPKPNIIYSTQQIHMDDSIRIIKNKILKEFEYQFSYKEIYLFSEIQEELPLLKVYQSFTNAEEIVSNDKRSQIFKNINIINYPQNANKYNDFISIPELKKEQTIKISIGQQFEKEFNYLFSANPFDIKYTFPELQNITLLSLENSLLLNYGNLLNNTIFISLANDVFEYAIKNQIPEDYISQLYFPLLYIQDIKTQSDLLANTQVLLDETKNTIDPNVWKLYETIDMFYDIYNQRTTELPYENTGINSFKILIKNDFKNILPFDLIFKNIHVSKDIPFIKYNPGFRRENIYRLYSEKLSKQGKKIPFLSIPEILKLSKDTSKSSQISIFLKYYYEGNNNILLIDFKKDGNLYISSDLQIPISSDKLYKLLNIFLNPVINNINGLLYDSGYYIPKINSLNDSFIEIMSINYTSSINITKKIDIQKYIGCISSIFEVKNDNMYSEEGIIFIFKRVENYKEMDPITLFISNEYYKTKDVEQVIYSLSRQFENIDENSAQELVQNFVINPNNIKGKKMEKSGFIIRLRFISSQNKIIIDIDNLTNLKYIDILQIYLDSFLRIYQEPDNTGVSLTKIKNMCKNKMNYTNVDKSTIENIIAPIEIQKNPNILNDPDILTEEVDKDFFKNIPKIFPEENEDKIEEEEDYFGMDMEGGEVSGIIQGGTEDEDLEINPEGISLNHPNPFQKKIEELDPDLIKETTYSRKCLHSDRRQPVILTDKQKQKIDKENPGSYENAIKYGSDPNHQFWYICPRYWSLKHNTSLTEDQVNKILETNPNAIIPNSAKVVPKNSYIFEFSKGNYVKQYPGLIKNNKSNPNGIQLPCCYTTPQKIPENNNENKDDKLQIKSFNNYIIHSTARIPKDRLGILPNEVYTFFKNKKCVIPDTNLLKPNTPCLLRYGVETSINNSFIGCFADIYAYEHELKNVPTITEMITIIINSISLDLFIQYHNGSLVSIFKPENVQNIEYNNIDKNKYNSEFISLFDEDITKDELIFLNETIASYSNFLKFLKDENSHIDHTFLWDIITQPNPKLIKTGLNLVILQIPKQNDAIEIVCPTSAYDDKLFNIEKRTFILLKQSDYYEPIYLFENKNNRYYTTKLLHKNISNANIKNILKIIEKTTNQYCKPKSSLPNIYNFKRNYSSTEIINIIKPLGYIIHSQVINYQTKTIGLVISYKTNAKFYIPCSPSKIMDDYEIEFPEDEEKWCSYNDIIEHLKKLHDISNSQIKCLPKNKIIDNNKIIGILTETNQYIKINPSIEYDKNKISELNPIFSNDYLEVDKKINTMKFEDSERIRVIKNIKIESQFYSVFRSTIRILFSYYENLQIKQDILEILENTKFKYKEKLVKIEILLKKLIGSAIVFQEMDTNFLSVLQEISSCNFECNKKKYCIMKEDGECQLIIPKYNLVMGIDNEQLYYGRISDEIVRFQRVRNFMLEPKQFLNLTNIEYKINKNEILILEPFLKTELLSDMPIFNTDEYVQNINYEIAMPDPNISQKYSNIIEKNDDILQ